MVPGKYNMVCPQGSTFSKQLEYSIDGEPVDLTGYTARMQVRETHKSKVISASLNTENGGITLGGAQGTIELYLSDEDTAAMVAKQYVYDIELAVGNNVYRLLEGKFVLTPEVTR